MKKAKISSNKLESMKGTMPLSSEDEPIVPPLPRKTVRKVKAPSIAPSASAPVPPSSTDHVSIFYFFLLILHTQQPPSRQLAG